MKISKNKNEYKNALLLFVKRHKLFFLFVIFWFYIMYLNNREFTFINVVLNLSIAFIFYLIIDGLINQK